MFRSVQVQNILIDYIRLICSCQCAKSCVFQLVVMYIGKLSNVLDSVSVKNKASKVHEIIPIHLSN